MTEAIVFDLDGTLLNTIYDIRDSMNRALAACGLPTHSAEDYCYFIGSGVRVLVERAVGESHLMLCDRVKEIYLNDYATNATNLTCPYEGIMALLEVLNKKRIPIAVFSNKPHKDTLRVIAHYFPHIAFAAVRGQMEGTAPKPDPAGAFEIARELRVAPENCLYVGDTDVDMICANNAGMKAIGVTWGFREREELKRGNAAFIADCPGEILRLI